MTVESVLCAVCGRSVPLDTDHVEIEAESVRMEDRNDTDEYVLHTECALNVLGGWTDPL